MELIPSLIILLREGEETSNLTTKTTIIKQLNRSSNSQKNIKKLNLTLLPDIYRSFYQ